MHSNIEKTIIKKTIFWPLILLFFYYLTANAGTFETISIQQNDAFRRDIMQFVQNTMVNKESNEQNKVSDKALDTRWFNGGSPTFYLINWAVKISIYKNGQEIGTGKASSNSLSKTLRQASIMAFKQTHLEAKDTDALKKAQFKITFYYPPDSRQYSMINDGDKTNELVGNIIPVRQMDTALLKDRIQSEKAYLLRMMDPEIHAFFKKYDAVSNEQSLKFRTIYTASSLYTLLQVQKIMPDPLIEQEIEPMTQFLFMMQETQGKNAGAFHYSYDKTTGKKDERFGSGRFVVGTASKTIFTLLMLYDKTHDKKYLDSAIQAGNWLTTRVDDNGLVAPVVVHVNGKLLKKTKQSFLYSGQVLSALSRLYAVTHDKAYYQVATKIAKVMVKYVEKKSAFLGDDYRTPNSVSTSWVVMSLVDYAKINTAPVYRQIITRSARELVNRQIHAPWDVFNDGRLMDIITTSGNGWVNEVMTVLYPFCKAEKMSGCESYRQFIINSSRWLIQNVYTSANSFDIKNPAVANGGVIRNFTEKSVRTDAVCHGLNSLVGLLEITGTKNQALVFLPEMPFDEVLGLLEMGRLPENNN